MIQTLDVRFPSEGPWGIAIQVDRNRFHKRLQPNFKALNGLFCNCQQTQKWQLVTESGRTSARHQCLLIHLTTPDKTRRTAKTGSDSNLHTCHINKQAKLGWHLAGGATQEAVGFGRVRGLAGGLSAQLITPLLKTTVISHRPLQFDSCVIVR